jgi:hypothetical protein
MAAVNLYGGVPQPDAHIADLCLIRLGQQVIDQTFLNGQHHHFPPRF